VQLTERRLRFFQCRVAQEIEDAPLLVAERVLDQLVARSGVKGLTAAQIAYWDGVLGKTVQTKDWKDHIERTQLTYRYLDSGEARTFITAQNETVRGILTGLGLIKK